MYRHEMTDESCRAVSHVLAMVGNGLGNGWQWSALIGNGWQWGWQWLAVVGVDILRWASGYGLFVVVSLLITICVS